MQRRGNGVQAHARHQAADDGLWVDGLAGWRRGAGSWRSCAAWSDCNGNIESRFSKDQILTLLSISGTRARSARPRAFTIHPASSGGRRRRVTWGRHAGGRAVAAAAASTAAGGGGGRPARAPGVSGLLRHYVPRSAAEVARGHGAGACQAVVVSRGRRSFSGSRSTQGARRGLANVLPASPSVDAERSPLLTVSPSRSHEIGKPRNHEATKSRSHEITKSSSHVGRAGPGRRAMP